VPRTTKSGDFGGALETVRKLPMYARLVWALLRDPRVPPQHKLILAGVVAYLAFPLDLIPDFIPVIGQLDDVAVALLGIDLFLKVAPKDVVAEHLARISTDADELRADLAQVKGLFRDRYSDFRATLQQRLTRKGNKERTHERS
jgi:uncharacterized membrane protein YkvA (DUF1232 family)